MFWALLEVQVRVRIVASCAIWRLLQTPVRNILLKKGSLLTLLLAMVKTPVKNVCMEPSLK